MIKNILKQIWIIFYNSILWSIIMLPVLYIAIYIITDIYELINKFIIIPSNNDLFSLIFRSLVVILILYYISRLYAFALKKLEINGILRKGT